MELDGGLGSGKYLEISHFKGYIHLGACSLFPFNHKRFTLSKPVFTVRINMLTDSIIFAIYTRMKGAL